MYKITFRSIKFSGTHSCFDKLSSDPIHHMCIKQIGVFLHLKTQTLKKAKDILISFLLFECLNILIQLQQLWYTFAEILVFFYLCMF